ncbi:MAG TPA: hypothetical protein VN414_09155 [Methanosarcina sp.]|nr:hypothetical protein [Methanosarcina sp.]
MEVDAGIKEKVKRRELPFNVYQAYPETRFISKLSIYSYTIREIDDVLRGFIELSLPP